MAGKMKGRVLAVGNDEMLLSTRISILKRRWLVKAARPSEALNILENELIDVVVLCHSIEPTEARTLVEALRKTWPSVRILALETLAGGAADLDVSATAVTTDGPSHMLDALERLFESNNSRDASDRNRY
jgi:PleD family two-component response regulator